MAAACLAVIALYFTMKQIKHQVAQTKYQAGAFYIGRYWAIDDDLLLTDEESDDHRKHQFRYLRLCEDEFEAALHEWLDLSQWKVWHDEVFGTADFAARAEADFANCLPRPESDDFRWVRLCTTHTRDYGDHKWEHCAAREEMPK